MCVCVTASVCISLCLFMCVSFSVFVCLCVFVFLCLCIFFSIYDVSICMSTFVCMCVLVCMMLGDCKANVLTLLCVREEPEGCSCWLRKVTFGLCEVSRDKILLNMKCLLFTSSS